MTFLPQISYQKIWSKAFGAIATQRQLGYMKKSNKGILEAGETALQFAKKKAETKGQKFGIGVCTTLAAAGQTAIATKMEEDSERWRGTKIKFIREQYPGMDDGHE